MSDDISGSPRAAVLLDIDGTLVDSTYHHALAWHRAFRSVVGVDGTPSLWRIHRTIGMGGDKLVAEVAGDRVEEEHGDALRGEWERNYAEVEEEVHGLPGAAALVEALAARGYVVALASSGKATFSRNAVELLGIGDHVAVLTTSDDAEESKPEADLLATTIARLREQGHAVDRAVLVGDTVYDVESAARAGFGCVCVRTGGYGVDELERAGAAVVVDDLTDADRVDWEDVLRPV